MKIKIALAGNPNSGKTTLFNALTGSNQYVGNWPGVTVEKKEGAMKSNPDAVLVDLPGIYSLSPYTPEEIVARNFLINERPDAILNIVDGTNLERNLYLTTQLMELGIPVVIAINMMDAVRKVGDKINTELLSKKLGCPIVEISALKGYGIEEAAETAIDSALNGKAVIKHIFSGIVEHAIAHIEEAAIHDIPEEQQRWYAVKLFERDGRVIKHLKISDGTVNHIENDIVAVEKALDDDADSIITNDRYVYIVGLMKECCKRNRSKMSTTDKIDSIVTNRFLALPIFALAMFLVYFIAIGSVGNWTVDFMNDTLFGEWIVPALVSGLGSIGCAPWLIGLIADGIAGGVGAVLGFVPQMVILFLLLSLLEDCGYMSRVAFVMDRIFRKFGLSGKSFIPMLVGSGCSVPGIMASRTIERESDRRMTVMTTSFIPCGAKMPFVGLIASALFGNSPWIATSAYFIGIFAVIITGIMLKKTKMFAGEPCLFVMELPAYHLPVPSNVARTVWDRAWGFIKRAGTVILAASVIIWMLNSFTLEGGLHYIGDGKENSVLNVIGSAIAFIFKPLGFGNWQCAVATLLGLVAKEEIVGVFGSLTSMSDAGIELVGQQIFGGSQISAFSFMVFNLLCAPCFAAMGAIRREMNSAKWTAFAITYQCVFAYAVCFIINQVGNAFIGNINLVGMDISVVLILLFIFFIFRPQKVRGGKNV